LSRRDLLSFPTRRSSDLITAWVRLSSLNCRIGASVPFWMAASLFSKPVGDAGDGIGVRLLLGERAARRVALQAPALEAGDERPADRKSTRLNSSHQIISY